ncbi:hypothetical protein [Schlesneria paludicola]|uniref:hypothetical protein n=1 Tax=Schlesneria paludicola TaxID=360056 RepID=UPI00029A24B9|nr:hypothetical protein [Schlesneria paludicola]
MQEFWRFLAEFFDDHRRYAAAMTILVALPFAFGWVNSIGYNNGFDSVQMVYAIVVVPLTALAAWFLLSSPRTKKPSSR